MKTATLTTDATHAPPHELPSCPHCDGELFATDGGEVVCLDCPVPYELAEAPEPVRVA